MGAILAGLLKAVLNLILPGFGFTPNESRIVGEFIMLWFKRIFKTKNGETGALGKKHAGLNAMSRYNNLAKRLTDEQLTAAFEIAEETMLKHVEGMT